jgi:hypothetical protein
MTFPDPDPLDDYAACLARMVAATSWFPHPDVVRSLGGAVFPTLRSSARHPRLSIYKVAGKPVGMFDDNTTPAWALAWSHDLAGTRPKGWMIAHVWARRDDIRSYTHLANLAMVREPFGCLTDKDGPLTGFLRWHASETYGWIPAGESEPTKPNGYDGIEWRYLEKVVDPKAIFRQRLSKANNQRTRILRPIMQNLLMV